jgi:hypothetical protein
MTGDEEETQPTYPHSGQRGFAVGMPPEACFGFV